MILKILVFPIKNGISKKALKVIKNPFFLQHF